MKKFIMATTLFLIPLLLVFGFQSIINYVDPLGMCFIKTDGDILKGNEETIKLALKKLKLKNPVKYQEVCHYTQKIVEQRCLTQDPHFGYPETIPAACYIKGSKIIYIEPVEEESDTVTSERMSQIIKASEYSREFWNSMH